MSTLEKAPPMFYGKVILLFLIISIVLLAVSCLGFAGGSSWICELLAAFRYQYLIGFFILLFVSILVRSRHIFQLALVGALINGVAILPFYLGSSKVELQKNAKVITVLQSNLYFHNHYHQRFIRRVQSLNPDIISLQEANKPWKKLLKHDAFLIKQYPYTIIPSGNDKAILSKYPLKDVKIETVQSSTETDTILSAKVLLGAKQLTVVVIHPTHPTNEVWSWRQAQVVDYLLAQNGAYTRPLLVIGDFNATPWSSQFQKLVESMALKNSMESFGIQGTWPSGKGIWMIPIDHALVSSDIQVLDRKTVSSIGSDHLPLLLKIAL